MAIANKLNSPLTGDRKLANKVGFAGDPDPVMVFVGGRPRVYLNWGPAKVSSLVQWLESDISGPWMLDSANTGDDRILNGGPGLDGGQAVDLDGASQYAVHADQSLAGDFTLTGWFKQDALGGVIWGRAHASKTEYIYHLGTTSMRLWFDGSDAIINHGHTFSLGVWNHLTVRRSGTTISIFKNAVPPSTTGTQAAPFTASYIGRHRNGGYLNASFFDVRCYDRALTDDEISHVYSFGESGDDPGLDNRLYRYKSAESSGSTLYDSNGGSLNATLMNGPGYVSQAIKSFSNDEGFSDNSGASVPIDDANPTNDVLGNTPDFIGSAPRHGRLLSPCGTFDGVDDYLSIAGLTGSETVTSSGGTSTPTISAGRVDFTAGTCWDLQLSNGDRYVFTEDGGTTIHNVTANARHATLMNASLPAFWAVTQSEFAWGCNEGYYNDSGVIVPALADGSSAADGSSLSHPASAFNGASTLDHDPYTIPALDSGNLDGMTPPAAHALGDSVVDAAQHFIRQTATKEDRFLLYSEDLVEPNLSKANSYTA